MLNKLSPFEGNLALESNSTVEEFLDHLGELLAREYIQLMEQASQNIEKFEISDN